MNKADKTYIKKHLFKILVEDEYTDSQTDDTIAFLFDLADRIGFDYEEQRGLYENQRINKT